MSLALISFALTVAGSIAQAKAQQAAARERQRRQRQLFENQDRFSKRTQEKLLSNLNKFGKEEEQRRRNKASQTSLDSIQKVSKAAQPIRRGKVNLGVAGKVSSAKAKRDVSDLSREARENALRNQALANFLGISGGQVKTGRELSNLGQSLNQLRTDAKGQLAVDQARVAHSPSPNLLFANILKAAGLATGFGAMANPASAASGSSSAALSKADAARTFGETGTSANWLGQTGGSAGTNIAAPSAINYTPSFFNAPTTQFGAKFVPSAPSFNYGNLIPR